MSAETTDRPSGLVEKRTIDYVPDKDRHGKVWQQTPFWFLGNFQVLTLSVGFIGPTLGLGFGWCVVASALGTLLGTLVMAFHASQGPHLGLPQLVQSRAQFGFYGVLPILLAAATTFISVNIVMNLVLRDGVSAMFGWNKVAVTVAAILLSTVIAVCGHDWLHRVFRVLLYVSLPLYLVLTAVSFLGAGRHQTATAPVTDFSLPAFATFFSICTAWNIAYALFVSDYSRYLPTTTKPKSIIAAVFFGASLSAIWLIWLGAWIATRESVLDPLTALRDAGDKVADGFGAVLVVGAIVTLVAVMALNTYSCTLTVLTGQDSFRSEIPSLRARVLTTIAVSAFTLAVSITLPSSALSALNDSTLVIFYLLVPWSAINLIDYFVVRRGQYSIVDLFSPDGLYGRWAWRGLLAYTLGLLAAAPFLTFTFYTGFAARALNGVDVSFVVSLLVAGGVYLATARSLDTATESATIQTRAPELQALAAE